MSYSGKITMYSCTKEQYLDATIDTNAFYWIEDTNEIYIGSTSYSDSTEFVTELPSNDDAIEGRLYYLSSTSTFSVWNGTSYVQLSINALTTLTEDTVSTSIVDAGAIRTYVAGEVNSSIVGVTYNSTTGALSFSQNSGNDIIVNMPLDNFLDSASYNSTTNVLTLILSDGSELDIDLNDLVDSYTFTAGDGIIIDNTSGTSSPVFSIKLDDATNNIASISEDGLLVEELTYTNSEGSAIVVGGIPTGTTFSNTSVSDILTMMLYPELNPTLTSPSVSSFTDNYSPTTVEVGTSVTSITFTANFSRGSISPSYGTSGYRSGLPTSYTYSSSTLTGLAGTNESSNLSDTKSISDFTFSVAGSYTATCTVAYSEGEQPLTSYGNDYSSALSASTVSKSLTVATAVYAYYATTSLIDTMTKQSLSTSSSYTVTLVSETDSSVADGDRQSIAVVSSKTLTSIQVYNTVAEKYAEVDITSFSQSSVTYTDASGNEVSYTKYTNTGDVVGSRQCIFTFN